MSSEPKIDTVHVDIAQDILTIFLQWLSGVFFS